LLSGPRGRLRANTNLPPAFPPKGWTLGRHPAAWRALTRAAGLLRPLAQQGELMRRDREWVLAGIERELAR
jgi:hypothetical protein